MKILVLGAGGQLGRQLCFSLPGDVVGLTRAACDITRLPSLRAAFEHRPDLVINAAGFTQVDRAESEPDAALAVNAHAVRELALLCRDFNATLIHFSTNYVFGADTQRARPYVETDMPGPISAYGQSKLLGEEHIRNIWPRHFILRTCGLYGTLGADSKRGNFVETMLRLASLDKPIRVVNDQVCTPTSAADLADGVKRLIGSDAYGHYHVTNAGACTWCEFAQAIFTHSKRAIEPITSAEFAAPARRPPFSVLSNERWANAGFTPLRPWQDALAHYLASRRP